MSQTEYVLKSDSALGLRQLGYLELLYDEPTKRFLADLDIEPGSRCLDIGAGAGSISRWLAERTGPIGSVVAIDIAPDHLEGGRNLVNERHDINGGLPDGGPFDLIHARLVLMHLARREELLAELIEGLAPGGWLVLGEAETYGTSPRDILSARTQADVEVFNHVVNVTFDIGRTAGIDYEWARRLGGLLVDAGLVDVRAVAYAAMTSGGRAGGMLTANYIRQVQSLVLDAGVTESELARFYELSLDPEFCSWMMPLVYYAARKAP